MNKNIERGFTLIELLAVIVILGIILVISVPIINIVINRAKYGAFNASKKGIERAAELYYASNSIDFTWKDNVSYIEVGKLKQENYLKKDLINVLNNMKISDDTKILLYKNGKAVGYSLQLYNDSFFAWYQEQMINGIKKDKNNFPINVGDKKTIDLNILMNNGIVDELRLPMDLNNRCVGYVEIEKTSSNNYNYNAFVDCLQEATTFASHYVSYGGKYLDEFNDVIETSDGGYVAVGRSNSEIITKYGTTNNGKYDAIIVKFSSNGLVEWSKNFGGSNNDTFHSVVETQDGYIAVGQAYSIDGDLQNIYNGGTADAIIVKYSKTGELLFKKSYGTSGTGSEQFRRIIKVNDGFVLVGLVDPSPKNGDFLNYDLIARRDEAIILKLDEQLKVVWRTLFGGTYDDMFSDVKKTSDGGYITVGYSNSNDGDMEGLGYNPGKLNSEALIVKYDSTGKLQYKKTFRGESNERFLTVIEVNDGYIAVGYSHSSQMEMEGIKKTTNIISDGIIVKYDKTLTNVLFKKSFGGSNEDLLYDILKLSDDYFISVGYSKSVDYDLQSLNIADTGYKKAVLIKYNATNGMIVDKHIFGGSNSDAFYKMIKTKDNNYVVAGTTFSSDVELKNFNKGHSDAILVKYDKSLNLIKGFQEPVVLIDKLKEITPDYGIKIESKYLNLYTTNNPEIDLNNWCTSYNIYTTGNTSNYYYGNCLRPYNDDDFKLLSSPENAGGSVPVTIGENTINIIKQPDNFKNWHRLLFYFGYSGGDMEISNLKLIFEDSYIGNIKDSVNNGYIEPLVTISSITNEGRPSGLMPTVFDIINENGSTGIASYPLTYINLKPKKSKLTGIKFNALRNVSTEHDGVNISEMRNFDMSIIPSK